MLESTVKEGFMRWCSILNRLDACLLMERMKLVLRNFLYGVRHELSSLTFSSP